MQKEINFFLKINKDVLMLELTFNEYTWSLNSSNINFQGVVVSGHYNYNNRNIVCYDFAKEFYFFEKDIRSRVVKILKKEKVLRNAPKLIES